MADESLKEKARISSVDLRGRMIAPEVMAAADQISGKALHFAEKAVGDPALALSLLEESAAVVSRVLAQNRNGNPEIRNLEAYLFRAFLRLVNRVRQREALLIEKLPTKPDQSSGSHSARKVELEILVDEILTRSDALTREMFYRRVEGYSWKEIGTAYGISAHAAEARFSHALRKLRKNLRS
jgi:DNA-directed RNA polymerase specialized sigma24 family protein